MTETVPAWPADAREEGEGGVESEDGAEEWTRTPTPLRVHGPEPCASANSATSASDWRNLLRIASGKNYTSYSTEAAEAVNGERPSVPSSGGYKLRHRRSAS